MPSAAAIAPTGLVPHPAGNDEHHVRSGRKRQRCCEDNIGGRQGWIEDHAQTCVG